MDTRHAVRTPLPAAAPAAASRILRGSERFEFQTPLPESSDGPGTTTRIRRGVSGKVVTPSPFVAPQPPADPHTITMICLLCQKTFSAQVHPANDQDRVTCCHCGAGHRISLGQRSAKPPQA
jgi:hypothetical protein